MTRKTKLQREAEARERFLLHLRTMAKYWAGVGTPEGMTTLERLDGLAFSLLTAIDGSAVMLPGYVLTEVGTGTVLNADCHLHDLYYEAPGMKGRR